MTEPERHFFNHKSHKATSEIEARYKSLFEDSPVSLWEEDLSEIKKHVDQLRRRGVKDFRSYCRLHTDEAARCAALVKVIDVNQATLKLYKAKTKEEFIAGLPTFFTPESYEAFQDALISFIEGRTEFSTETVNKTLTGESINVSLRLSVAPGYKETLSRILVSVIDITELKQSQQQFEVVLRTAIDGFWVADTKGRFLDVNDAYCGLIGYSRDELLTMRIHDVEAAEKPEETAEHMRHITEVGADRFETRHRRKDGKVLDIEVSVNYMDLAGGKFFVFLRDITEGKRAKELSVALNEINMTITSTLNVKQVLDQVTKAAWTAMGSETAAVILRKNGAWAPGRLHGFSPKPARDFKHLTALAAKIKKPLVVPDTSTDPRVDRALIEEAGIRSFVALPLMIRDDVFGILAFQYHSAPLTFTDAQIDFANKLAVSISLALENAESYQALQQALDDARILGRVAARVNQTLELEAVLDTALDETLRALSIEHGCIYVFDDSGHLVIKSQRRLSQEFLNIKSIIGPGDGCAGEAVVTKKMFAPTKESRHFVCADSEKLLGLDCLAAVPIVSRGESLGVLEVFAPVARRLSSRERGMAEAISNQLAAALQNARLYGEERSIAKALQTALLTIPDKISGIDFGHLYRSATTEAAEVGGDFYDLFEMENGKIGLIIGDVSGKGLEAAALTSRVKNTLKAYAYQHDPPSVVMTKTNRIICKEAAPFVTVFFGILDTISGKLVYCSAGHPEPIVKRRSGSPELLKTRSPAIGILAGLEFLDDATVLETGALLFLYTDGVIEARETTALFGLKRLTGLIETLEPAPPSGFAKAVFAAVMRFAGGSLADDVAILTIALERQPGP